MKILNLVLVVVAAMASFDASAAQTELRCKSIYVETLGGGKSKVASEGKLVGNSDADWDYALVMGDRARNYTIEAGKYGAKSWIYLRTTDLATGDVQIHKSHDVNFGPLFYFDVLFSADITEGEQRYRAVELECVAL